MQLEGSEDPFYWIDPSNGAHHMLVHSKEACGQEGQQRCGLLASSSDGIKWTSASKSAFTGHVTWRSSGNHEHLELMQRPKILFHDDGVTPLFLFCGIRRLVGSKRLRAVHTLAIPFNVPQNAHLIPGYPSINTSSDAAELHDEDFLKPNILLEEDENEGNDDKDGEFYSLEDFEIREDEDIPSNGLSRKANAFFVLAVVLCTIFIVARVAEFVVRIIKLNVHRRGVYVPVATSDYST